MIDHWVEIVAFALLIIGFVLALVSHSAVISYFVVFFCGAIAGRIWFFTTADTKATWALIIIGFMIGFVLGTFYGDRWIVMICYAGGLFVGYWLHKEGYIKSVHY